MIIHTPCFKNIMVKCEYQILYSRLFGLTDLDILSILSIYYHNKNFRASFKYHN